MALTSFSIYVSLFGLLHVGIFAVEGALIDQEDQDESDAVRFDLLQVRTQAKVKQSKQNPKNRIDIRQVYASDNQHQEIEMFSHQASHQNPPVGKIPEPIQYRFNAGVTPACVMPVASWLNDTFTDASQIEILHVNSGGDGLQEILEEETHKKFKWSVVDVKATDPDIRVSLPTDSKDVVMFVEMFHHVRDNVIDLLVDAAKVARQFVVVNDFIHADEYTEAELLFSHEWKGIYRPEHEWERLFGLAGYRIVFKQAPEYLCGHLRDLRLDFFRPIQARNMMWVLEPRQQNERESEEYDPHAIFPETPRSYPDVVPDNIEKLYIEEGSMYQRQRSNHVSPPVMKMPAVHFLNATYSDEIAKDTEVLDVGGGFGLLPQLVERETTKRFKWSCVDLTASEYCEEYPGNRLTLPANSRDVVVFCEMFHHVGDSVIDLLEDAAKVARQYVIVIDMLHGDDFTYAVHGYGHEWQGNYRHEHEWERIFDLLGYKIVYKEEVVNMDNITIYMSTRNVGWVLEPRAKVINGTS